MLQFPTTQHLKNTQVHDIEKKINFQKFMENPDQLHHEWVHKLLGSQLMNLIKG